MSDAQKIVEMIEKIGDVSRLIGQHEATIAELRRQLAESKAANEKLLEKLITRHDHP